MLVLHLLKRLALQILGPLYYSFLSSFCINVDSKHMTCLKKMLLREWKWEHTWYLTSAEVEGTNVSCKWELSSLNKHTSFSRKDICLLFITVQCHCLSNWRSHGVAFCKKNIFGCAVDYLNWRPFIVWGKGVLGGRVNFKSFFSLWGRGSFLMRAALPWFTSV